MIALAVVVIIAVSIWVIAAVATGIGLGRVIARADSEEGLAERAARRPLPDPVRA